MVSQRTPWVSAIAVCLLLEACGAGWRRERDLAPGPLPSRQQAQLWHQGRVERWHALVVGPDSISGIPYFRPTDCDTCRLALARTQVDSVCLGNPEAGFWKTAALVVTIPVLIFGVIILSTPPD
jgi:hypothetical protein